MMREGDDLQSTRRLLLEPMAQRDSPARLALILTEFPPSVGGMQTHAEFLAQALHDAGHAICVYTYRCDDPHLATAAGEFDRQAPYPVHRVLSRVGFLGQPSPAAGDPAPGAGVADLRVERVLRPARR